VGRRDYSVRVDLLLYVHVRQPCCLVLDLDLRQKVRILVTVLYAVPDLFAAETPLVPQLPKFFLFLFYWVLVLFILNSISHFVLHELAAGLVFTPFATAPPHFAAPFRLVHTTRPVEILLLIELLATVLALFQALVEFTFSCQ